MTQTLQEWRLSAPPPDEWAPVQVVAQGVLRRSLNAEETFRRSPPPVEVSAPVQAIAQGAPAPALRARAQNTPPDPALVALKEADYAEAIGDAEDPPRKRLEPAAEVLDTQTIYRIVREVALADSGEALYSAVAADSEYETPGHSAYHARHFGLGYGLVLFTQESGRLGSVLRLMRQRDQNAFAEIFGPPADALLAVTTAPTPEERLAPVGGEPLWSMAWIERFRRAGELATFQAAQNEEAIEGQFRPMLRIALDLGLTSECALAMAYDRVVTRGLGAGLRWVVGAAGVLQTAGQRAAALRLLGMSDLIVFQRSTAHLPQDGQFGPATHAALVRALREQDLVPLPTPTELSARLVQAAKGSARQRLERLRDSPVLEVGVPS
jgi:hypothetical protein